MRPKKKSLNLEIPVDLYNMFAKTCIDYGITKTEGIIRYFKYLQHQQRRKKEILDEGTATDTFTLDE